MSKVSVRTSRLAPAIREDRRLTAYFSVFNSPTTIKEHGQTFQEVILPGAFKESLRNDVVLTINHDMDKTFATNKDGLYLEEDEHGLFGTVYLDQAKDEVRQRIEKGDVTGCSFTGVFSWNTLEDGTHEVYKVNLSEVTLAMSPIQPAYKDTASEVMLRTQKDNSLEKLLLRLRFLKLRR